MDYISRPEIPSYVLIGWRMKWLLTSYCWRKTKHRRGRGGLFCDCGKGYD